MWAREVEVPVDVAPPQITRPQPLPGEGLGRQIWLRKVLAHHDLVGGRAREVVPELQARRDLEVREKAPAPRGELCDRRGPLGGAGENAFTSSEPSAPGAETTAETATAGCRFSTSSTLPIFGSGAPHAGPVPV